MKRLLIGAFLLVAQNAAAQTPADEARLRWELAINTTRTDRLLALAPAVMPACDITASKDEMDKFYAFWRVVVHEEIEQYNALGRPLVDPNEETERLQMKQIGMVILRQYQLPDLARIGPEMPNANRAVIRQIEIWKALHCVVEKYDGQKFFTSNGASRMNMAWPYGSILSVFGYDSIPADPERTRAYRLPNMLDIEPLDALGRFFRAAEARRDLVFPDEDTEKYFFQRYESDYFYDMTDASKARAWFHTPPWNVDAPHLERPTRSLRAHAGE